MDTLDPFDSSSTSTESLRVNSSFRDDAGYVAIHELIYKKLGKPKKCFNCGLSDQNRVYNWANIDHKYKRELKDWIRLCVPCHRKHDKYIDYISSYQIREIKT